MIVVIAANGDHHLHTRMRVRACLPANSFEHVVHEFRVIESGERGKGWRDFFGVFQPERRFPTR